MAFKGGVKEAAKMLQGLGHEAAQKLLTQIREQDPNMARVLEENLISINDLQYLTPTMLVSLLRDISLEVFGLSLRTVDKDIVDKLLGMMSTGIRLEVEDGLSKGLRPVSEVQKAQAEVLQLVRKKVDSGQIVLNPDGDKLV